MTSIYLAPPSGAVPRMKIELFNTLLSNADARGVIFPDDPDWDQTQAFDQYYDPMRCGWITFSDEDLRILNFRYEEDVCRVPHGFMDVVDTDMWLFGYEIIQRPTAAIYWDGTNNEGPINQPTVPCNLIVYVDSEGVVDSVTGEQDFPFGEVWIYGEDMGGSKITEFVPVYGTGCFITAQQFALVEKCGASFNEGEGSHSTISIWGNCGTSIGRRECRVWIDANGDGVYGLVHSGYIAISDIHPTYGITVVTLELFGYGAFLLENDYVTGYKCGWRCKNFSKTGESGSCLVNSTHFRGNANACFIGDQGIYHPNGTTATLYCTDYDPGMGTEIEALPFDGWTYYADYTWSADTGYEVFPPNYFRAIQAATNMANSHEYGKPVSRSWTMASKYVLTVQDDNLDPASYMIQVGVPYATFDVEECSYLTIGEEVLYATTIGELAGGGVDMIVERGAMNTNPAAYVKGDIIRIPYVGIGIGSAQPNPLCLMGSCPAPDLKASIATTIEKLAKNATVICTDAEYMTWADRFKQIQFSEMYKLNPGADATGGSALLTVRTIDIVDEPRLSYSDVVNEVSAQIHLADGTTLVARMKAEDIGIAGYEKSVQRFGRFMQEEDTPFLNSYGPVAGKVDFVTWATNYLRLRAFPVLVQEICVFGFVPDEHYWETIFDTWDDPNDERCHPLLERTDIANRSIDLRGVRIEAPDYSKVMTGEADDIGTVPSSTWVVQGVATRLDPPGDLRTWLILRRYTTPEDFI